MRKSGDKATGTKNFIIGGGGGVKFKIPFLRHCEENFSSTWQSIFGGSIGKLGILKNIIFGGGGGGAQSALRHRRYKLTLEKLPLPPFSEITILNS